MIPERSGKGEGDEKSRAAARTVVTGFKDALRAGDGEAAVRHLHPDVRVSARERIDMD